MVHALEEAWRVLRPDGLLIDLRPAMVHRTVGIEGHAGVRPVGVMKEVFDDDIRANRAVASAIRGGLFRRVGRQRFDCARVMDSVEAFREWLAYPVSLGKLPPHERLTAQVAKAMRTAPRGAAIVVRGPLDLSVLEKRSEGR